jgi:hypothetical protein
MNITTKTFPRVSRGNGTEYAASIERSRRRDCSGLIIIIVCAAIMASPYLIMAWRVE